MIAATSDAYAEAKEQADEYLQVAGRAIEAEVGSGENVKTMEDYLNYRNQFLKVAIEEYNMSED
jgi:hypothetical protein